MARAFKVSGKLTLDTKTFQTAINAVSKKVGTVCRNAQKDFRALSKTLTSVGVDMMALGGPPLAGALLGFKKLVDAGGDLADLSKQLGVSTAALSELRYAASLSGVGMEDLSKGFQIMQKNLGNGKSKDALKTLGLDQKSIKAAAPDQAFEKIIDALGRVKNQSDRMNLAQQVFGKGGGMFLRLAEGGAAGIRQLREEAKSMGISIGDDLASKLDDTGDNWDRLMARVDGLKTQLAVQLAPTIGSIIDWLNRAAVAVGQFAARHPDLVKWVSLGGTAVAGLTFVLGGAAFALGRVFSLMSTGFGTLKSFMKWIGKLTASKVADTVATEANTAATVANNAAKAAGGGAGGALGMLGKAGLVAGAAVAGWEAGRWIDKKTENTWFGRSVDWMSDKAVGATNWITGANKPEAQLGERTLAAMKAGKVGQNAPANAADKALMERQNKLMEEQNALLKQVVSNTKSTPGGVSKQLAPAF